MARVLLITRNKVLAEFCRKNLPDGFVLKTAIRLAIRSEMLSSIVVFDSGYLLEVGDAVITLAADKFGARDGDVSLNILMNAEHRSRAFSLFPEHMKVIQGILQYRVESEGTPVEPTGAEWRWFLLGRERHLRFASDHAQVQNENRQMAARLAEIGSTSTNAVNMPAALQGNSAAIMRFREQVLSAASGANYIFLKSKDEIAPNEFLKYVSGLLWPEKPGNTKLIDAAELGRQSALVNLPPFAERREGGHQGKLVIGLKNLGALSRQNQNFLISQLFAGQRGLNPAGIYFVFFSSAELAAAVKKGSVRQEFYSLLKKSRAELPPLYERLDDITTIASEYIAQRNFKKLAPEHEALASRLLNSFDISSGYAGLYLTLDLLNDVEKSKGLPVYDLVSNAQTSDAMIAAKKFLRERAEPLQSGLFQGLAAADEQTLSLDIVERNYIAAVCERYAWQVTEAARHLKISRKTLYDKMRRYKLERPANSGRQRKTIAS